MGTGRAGWRRRGWAAAQRLGAGWVWWRTWVGVSVVPRFVERPLRKGPVPAHKDRLQEKVLQPSPHKDRLQGAIEILRKVLTGEIKSARILREVALCRMHGCVREKPKQRASA